MWGYGPGYMMGGWGHGFGGVGMIVWLAILVALVGGAVWVARNIAARASSAAPRRSPALDVLEGRYARGEIERDEYLEKRTNLVG